jgi:hypothetical protein
MLERLAILLAFTLVTGCGAEEPDPGPSLDFSVSGCLGNCAGCCQGNQCMPGNSADACGLGGLPCNSCSPDQTCVAGQCQGGPPKCDPTSCQGCCEAGSCKAGYTVDACGVGGVPCVKCKQGQTCNGACVGGGCGPGTCDGCCEGTTCYPGTFPMRCGSNGQPCQACQPPQTCTNKVCTGGGGCNPGNCTSGAPCKACPHPYQQCSGGACSVDASSKWQMTVVSASIKPIKEWDTLVTAANKPPDPFYVRAEGGCGYLSWKVSSCSSYVANTFDAVWNHVTGPFTAQEWKANWNVVIGDSDSVAMCAPPTDTIACCAANIGDQDLVNGFKEIFSCPNPDDNINHINSIKLKFDYMP